jgi:hypothetical protein
VERCDHSDRQQADDRVLNPQACRGAISSQRDDVQQDDWSNPDRPRHKHRRAKHGEQRRDGAARAVVPDGDHPPRGTGEQLGDYLRPIGVRREGSREIRVRHEQQDHRRKPGQRSSIALDCEPPRDRKNYARLQRDGQHQNRVDYTQRHRPRPCASERDQQVAARRVIHHVAEVRVQRRIVHQPPVALDVVDQHQMMCEIRSSAERQKIRCSEHQEKRASAGNDHQQRDRM